MKLKIKTTLLAMLTLVTLALGTSSAAFAANNTTSITIGGGANSAQGEGQSACLFKGQAGCDDSTPIFQIVTNVLLFIIGAVSVIMLIIGGIRYTVSQGDSGAVTSAKNTILYSIVGIVVALLAYAAVNFVIGNFATNASEGAVLLHL